MVGPLPAGAHNPSRAGAGGVVGTGELLIT